MASPSRGPAPAMLKWLHALELASILALAGCASPLAASPVTPAGTPTATALPILPACASENATLGTTASQSVASISMGAPGDGWAVGVDRTAAPQGLLVHGRGCTWTPIPTGLPHTALYSVSMTSPTDGWALGGRDSWDAGVDGARGTSVLLHWTGSAWHEVPLTLGAVYPRSRIRMVSQTEGWMLVNGGNVASGGEANYIATLWHYAGGTWTPVDMPFKTRFTQVWGMAALPGECWVDGYNSRGYIAHWKDGAWQTLWTSQEMYYDIAMPSTGHGWAVGNGPTLMGYQTSGWVSLVSTLPSPMNTPSDFDHVAAVSSSEMWAFMDQVWSSSDSYYTGQTVTALHISNGHATVEVLPLGPVSSIQELAMATATEGWAVGERIESGQRGTARGVIVHYLNGKWTNFEPFVPKPTDNGSGPIG